MRLDTCIDAAVAAGRVTPDRAEAAKGRFRELLQRYEDSGYPTPIAEIAAADEAMESIVREARARTHVTVLQLRQMQAQEARYATAHRDDPDRILKDIEVADAERQGLERSFMATIHDILRAHRTNIIGQVRNRAALYDIVRELHGQNTGNATAKAMADAFRAAAERARRLFNALGGDIGKLDDWGMAHRHDAQKIEQAGFAAWFDDLWSNDRIAWHRIEDFSTGKPFTATPGAKPNRKAAEAFLRGIFDSITTRGWSDRFPTLGGGARSMANTRAAHRTLHFRDGDAWIAYNERFGGENPFEAMIGHLRGMARDIALMRAFGPNPRLGLEHAIQVIERAAQTDAAVTGIDRTRMVNLNASKAAKARTMVRILTGQNNQPASALLARFMAGTRNVLTAAQLGSAPLSSVTDWASARLAAKAVGLNPNSATTAMVTQIAGAMPAQQARDLGFIMDTWFDTGAASARFMGDIWSPEITSRVTNFVLRANLLSYLTDRSRVAQAAAFGSDLGDMAGRSFDELPPSLRNFMASRRVGAREWDAVRASLYTAPNGSRHVNPDWFRSTTALPAPEAEDIAIRWAGLVQAHVEMAIPNASLRGRATILGDAVPGSIGGELLRSTAMYKSYALSVLFGQLRRITELDGGRWSKATYAAKYVVFMTLMGAVAVQLKETAKGRDPRPMDDQAFWYAALFQGGGLGIFGDFFASETSRTGGGLAETAAGPAVGLIGDIVRAGSSNAARLAEGKDMLIGRDVANLARRYNPLATFQPPIPVPTRLALDRILWDEFQRFLDPEAEDLWRQAEGRMKRDYGTQSFWQRGETSPRRGPDLSNALGDMR